MTESITDALDAFFTQQGRAEPFAAYARLTATCPVLPVGQQTIVTGFAQCSAALRQPGLHTQNADWAGQQRLDWASHPSMRIVLGSVMSLDGDEHTELRTVLAKPFLPRNEAALQLAVHRQTTRLIEELAHKSNTRRDVDFVGDFSALCPAAVFADLLGVDAARAPWLIPRLDAITAVYDLSVDAATLTRADEAAQELIQFAETVLSEPGPGPLAEMLVGLKTAKCNHDTAIASLIVLLAAGIETTRNMLSNAVHHLATSTATANLLRERPGLVPGFISEILRTAPPVHITSRWTQRPTDLGDASVGAGNLVLVTLAAANRDPARFDEPDTFRLDRNDEGLTFGSGRHYCLGASLARMLGCVAVAALLERFATMEVAGDPTRHDELVVHGLATLPLRLTTANR
ncbi:cytochrome P450 [Streptomycetaceae bacterium NBC_01309]